MATIFDEYGNPIGDDGETYGYDDPTLYNNPWMQPTMPGQNFSTSKWNFGAPQAVGQNVYNQFLTGQKNQAQLFSNPSFRYQAMVDTGQPLFDMNSLMGLDEYGMPYAGAGGGGGGGGGSGYNPNFMTNNLDALKNAAPGTPENLIYTGITTGQSPLQIKRSLREDGAYDTETLKVIDQQVDDAFGEYAGAQRNQLAGQNMPAQQTPIQEWLAKNGLINPATQYTAENLPADIDLGSTGDDWRGAGNDAIKMAVSTGANVKRLNDERKGLQAKAQMQYLVDELAKVGNWQKTKNDAEAFNSRPVAPGGGTYAAGAGGTPINIRPEAGGARQEVAIPEQPAMGPRPDTGQVGGWAGGFMRPVKDAIAQRVNPGGDVARMAMLKRSAAAQQRRKADLVASAQATPAYEQAVRQLAAQQVQQSGRTPARDAQRVLLNYMRQGGRGI